MILLRRLRITAFKHLRAIDLWLPRRGSVLIEGHNESGKSTLFEAIYFALYGKALVGEDAGQPSLEALIPHGESRAGVQLTIAAGATELEITRTLLRGPQQVKHEAELRILRPGRPAETISAVKAVNDCILNELNGLDGAVLRNSCLMEQQALDRIETLTTANREMAIAKLLGIEALQRIEQDLKVVKKDEAQLAQAQTRLEVAHKWEEARQAGETARTTAVTLRAARARTALLARDSLATRLQSAHDELNAVTLEAAHLRERSQRAALLDALRLRSDENTRLLHDAEQQATALEMLRARQGHAASADEITSQLVQADADIRSAEEREQEQHAQLHVAQHGARSAGLLASIATLAFLMMCAVGVVAHLLWLAPLALALLVTAIVLCIRRQQLQSKFKSERGKLVALERETVQLRATREAVQRLIVNAGEPEAQEASATLIAQQQQQAAMARGVCAQAIHEMALALAAADITVPAVSPELDSVDAMRRTHEAMARALQAEMARLDVGETQRRQGSLDAREQHLRTLHDELIAQREDERRRLATLLAEQGITATGDEPLDELVTGWPALAEAGAHDALAAALERAIAIEEQLRQQVEALCHQHGLDAETLDAAACQQAYDTLDQELRQRRLAAEMADEVFKRIVQRVLPETEMHMRALLPELTDGRYRDVTLLSDDENSADLRIRVWDEQARRYVGKSLFSGGTRDQCSLALRLAFALATLPKELGAMPGFIFLDEPLSSFDDRRSQALVDVLTRGPIARQFPQVFLISHSQSFDPDAFTCALRMAGGRVASSTLPDEATARAQWQPD